MARGLQRSTRLERFWSRVDRKSKKECWPWLGAKFRGDYGKVLWQVKPTRLWISAHRVAWELINGRIEKENLCVCHSCDNPPCCNPDHLFLGTRAVNNLDKKRKGRTGARRGEANGRAKLSETEIREIQRLLANGCTQTAVAKKYGMAQPQISRIQRGLNWGYVK